ncbi:endonuclease [Flavobacterium sp.]|uniref:endonuclease n=1 Tax=Flavobacterium sp. TaxID=239 RepID=UPI003D0AFEB9
MKKLFITFLTYLIASQYTQGQAGTPASPYYNGFNWTLTSTSLRDALSSKITLTHTNKISYTPGVWEASKITDLDPEDPTNTNVLLIYGYDNTSICPTSTLDTHRRRDKNANGGGNSCQWNREHVYAKSLGTPALIDGGSGATSDAGEDAHHIRPADVDWNGNRADEKYTDSSGNSRDITTTTWYPGDEWKGDVARMILYMYLRYPTQCLPINVGVGTPMTTDSNMIDLFLKWNAEDPVSQVEDNRNTYHDSLETYAQGNRNPFIDNPYLATVIWGGPVAQNRWPNVFLDQPEFSLTPIFDLYPNPTVNDKVILQSNQNIDQIEILSIQGQIIKTIINPPLENHQFALENLNKGLFFINVKSKNNTSCKKLIIN